MSISRFNRSPLGSFYRSPLGVRGRPADWTRIWIILDTPTLFTANATHPTMRPSLAFDESRPIAFQEQWAMWEPQIVKFVKALGGTGNPMYDNLQLGFNSSFGSSFARQVYKVSSLNGGYVDVSAVSGAANWLERAAKANPNDLLPISLEFDSRVNFTFPLNIVVWSKRHGTPTYFAPALYTDCVKDGPPSFLDPNSVNHSLIASTLEDISLAESVNPAVSPEKRRIRIFHWANSGFPSEPLQSFTEYRLDSLDTGPPEVQHWTGYTSTKTGLGDYTLVTPSYTRFYTFKDGEAEFREQSRNVLRSIEQQIDPSSPNYDISLHGEIEVSDFAKKALSLYREERMKGG